MENNPDLHPKQTAPAQVRLPGNQIRSDVMALVAGQEVQRAKAKGRFQWEVLLVSLIVLSGVVALGWPWRTRGGEEPKSSEARAGLGAMKDRARVVYQRTGKVPQTLEDLGLGSTELSGTHFTDKNYKIEGQSAKNWIAVCSNVFSAEPRDLRVTANFETGSATFNR